MLNLTAEELDKMLIESNERTGSLRSELATVVSEIGQLNQKKNRTEQKITTQEKKLEAIRKALILVQGATAKVSRERSRLLRRMERAGREDITVAESKSLGTEIEGLKVELHKICTHPVVYCEQGYSGSRSQDYEDKRPEHRYCVVCGFSEDGKSSGQYDYVGIRFDKLAEADGRIVEDEPWTPEGRKRVNIWLPLGAVLHPFEESVARVLNS